MLRMIRLRDCTEIGQIETKREHTFQVRSPQKVWTLAANTAESMEQWLLALQTEYSKYAPAAAGLSGDLDG